MTKDAIKERLNAQVSEYFDGYIVIGRVAGENTFVADFHFESPETRLKLMIAVAELVQSDDSFFKGLDGHTI